MKSYQVISNKAELDELFNDKANEAKRTELANYIKCVAYNHDRFMALTDLRAMDGSRVDNCCAPIEKETIKQIMRDFVMIALDMPKINGKINNWNSGGMGSRWLDMDASEYGLDYIRCAFYSKKFYGSEWRSDKPFAVQIMCEKAK